MLQPEFNKEAIRFSSFLWNISAVQPFREYTVIIGENIFIPIGI